jgi:hypothetical protein
MLHRRRRPITNHGRRPFSPRIHREAMTSIGMSTSSSRRLFHCHERKSRQFKFAARATRIQRIVHNQISPIALNHGRSAGITTTFATIFHCTNDFISNKSKMFKTFRNVLSILYIDHRFSCLCSIFFSCFTIDTHKVPFRCVIHSVDKSPCVCV